LLTPISLLSTARSVPCLPLGEEAVDHETRGSAAGICQVIVCTAQVTFIMQCVCRVLLGPHKSVQLLKAGTKRANHKGNSCHQSASFRASIHHHSLMQAQQQADCVCMQIKGSNALSQHLLTHARMHAHAHTHTNTHAYLPMIIVLRSATSMNTPMTLVHRR